MVFPNTALAFAFLFACVLMNGSIITTQLTHQLWHSQMLSWCILGFCWLDRLLGRAFELNGQHSCSTRNITEESTFLGQRQKQLQKRQGSAFCNVILNKHFVVFSWCSAAGIPIRHLSAQRWSLAMDSTRFRCRIHFAQTCEGVLKSASCSLFFCPHYIFLPVF